jgi:hypothetical protein
LPSHRTVTAIRDVGVAFLFDAQQDNDWLKKKWAEKNEPRAEYRELCKNLRH